jgi:hypothetical protein
METAWLGAGAVVCGALLGLAALVGDEVWRRRIRRRFLRQRPLLAATSFCQAVAASPGEERWWVELRRALAAQCFLPAEAVYPDDTLDTLEAMTFDGWDFFELECILEEELGMPIPDSAEEHRSTRDGPETVRDVGESLVRTLRASIPSSEGASRTGSQARSMRGRGTSG